MPDILIHGLEMPREDDLLCLNIHPNGDVTINLDLKCIPIARAVELPQHGDLIDRRELLSTVMQVVTKFPTSNIAAIEHLDLVSALLRGATVVIPAEKGEGK